MRATAARSRLLMSVNGGRRQAGLAQALLHGQVDGAARAQAVRAAAQDGGIARFEAERAGIRGHIGAAFVDDADDAERHPHPLDGHAVRPRPGSHDAADRVLRPRMTSMPGGHGLDAGLVERQPVEKGLGGAGGARFGDILGVFREDLALLGADRGRHPLQRPVLLRGRGRAPARGPPHGHRGRFRPWRRPISRVPSMLFSGAVMFVNGPSAHNPAFPNTDARPGRGGRGPHAVQPLSWG